MGNEHDDEDNSHDVVYFCTSLLRKEGGGRCTLDIFFFRIFDHFRILDLFLIAP
jgi:hypothetical protein